MSQSSLHEPGGKISVSRRKLAGKRKSQSLYFKFVDPDEREQERYEVYEGALEHMKELSL